MEKAKLTPKQEAFAKNVASGMSQAEAYRNSYNTKDVKQSTVQENASRLMANSKVAARVEELRAVGAEKAAYTLADHLERLAELGRGAEAEGKFDAAIKAEEIRGKAAGFHTAKVDVTTKGESLSPPAVVTSAMEAFLKANV